MEEAKHYNDFSTWLRHELGCKVQKISIDAGFSCPNRDGTLATGGCIFCDNKAFSPAYCRGGKSVKRQMEDGISFFKRKYKDMKYLAYFQAFTNTYASVERLKCIYEEALDVEDVVGIVIGTRPDCVSDEILEYLDYDVISNSNVIYAGYSDLTVITNAIFAITGKKRLFLSR